MPSDPRQSWGGSLHQTFRLLPSPSPHLRPFLEADGLKPEHILQNLPYDQARAGNSIRDTPDPKRYRDGKQVYQTVGFLYEGAEGLIHVTSLGKVTLRWLNIMNEKNVIILGRHAAYALAACQLRNPSGAGRHYDESVEVFPFAFIWRAMLALDGKLSSDELNRAIFKIKNEVELDEAIWKINEARQASNLELLGEETITGEKKNDRIIPWISIASFGWTLFPDKRGREGGSYYEIPPRMIGLLKEASQVRHKHHKFKTVEEYVEHIARAAALPEDLR